MFSIVVKFENLMKWKMKIELYWNNQMKIIMSLLSFCLGRGMFGIRDVWDVRCLRCGMFGMWDVRDVGCSRYGMFRMWDMGCGMLIYKMPKFFNLLDHLFGCFILLLFNIFSYFLFLITYVFILYYSA